MVKKCKMSNLCKKKIESSNKSIITKNLTDGG